MKLLLNKSNYKLILSIAVILLSFSIISADDAKNENKEISFGREFFSPLSSAAFFQKDLLFDSLIKKPMNARAFFLSLNRTDKYKSRYRAVFSDEESSKYGFKILYYLYFSDKDFIDSMQKDELYKFKGSIIGWTPLDSQRKEFIFEIKLQEITREYK